ncbi:unnamed protein product [Arctia plantaginis]|uniref:Uncharacterized protein n=1 Tax=Arctia plantaginis TaxID=874455 RepID=A0A8S1AYN1_ARCPL|nr:unnamed protein product [Arctia plantaginis]CAB3259985.1 unnamed protein product [Arctia plantaginis]
MNTFFIRKLGLWRRGSVVVCVPEARRLAAAWLCACAPPLGLSPYLPRAGAPPHTHTCARALQPAPDIYILTFILKMSFFFRDNTCIYLL